MLLLMGIAQEVDYARKYDEARKIYNKTMRR